MRLVLFYALVRVSKFKHAEVNILQLFVVEFVRGVKLNWTLVSFSGYLEVLMHLVTECAEEWRDPTGIANHYGSSLHSS